MNFKFTAEQEAFRQEIRAFLAENPPERFPVQQEDDGYGLGDWSYEFTRLMGSKGWISLTWPKEYGGQGRPLMDLLVLLEELAYAGAPMMGTCMSLPLGPTLIEAGSETLKKELLPGIASGAITFWLALSEPQAGSDVLGVKTRATEEGDCYVINGQKVWSSYAHLADYGFLLARTDPDQPAQRGVSMFVLEKKLPGVDVRPLISLAGNRVHNEVFLDNVRVPKSHLVGEKDRGFSLLLKGLEVDRFWGRFVKPPFCKGVLEQLVQYCRETRSDGKRLAERADVRHKLAESAIEIESCRLLFYHISWMMQQGLPITYEASMAKVIADEMGQRFFNNGMQVLGPFSQLGEATKWAPLRARMQRWYLFATGHTLAGGSGEVVRNNVAVVGLGMPRS